MAYSVAQRTHEIGVRLALGAEPRQVLKLVMGQGMRIVLIGAAAGFLGSLAVVRLLREMLFGVAPFDVVTFAAVPVVLIAAALAASYIPARRATRVDPMLALRYE